MFFLGGRGTKIPRIEFRNRIQEYCSLNIMVCLLLLLFKLKQQQQQQIPGEKRENKNYTNQKFRPKVNPILFANTQIPTDQKR